MGRKGQATRDRLLEVAEQYILQRGFAGTSIDDVINEVVRATFANDSAALDRADSSFNIAANFCGLS